MIEQEAYLYTVQKLLGHKTNVMTQRLCTFERKQTEGRCKGFRGIMEAG